MGVIDLRKSSSTQKPTGTLPSPVLSDGVTKSSASISASHPQQKLHKNADLEWSGPEHEHRVRGPYWFIGMLAIATGAIVFSVMASNYLFVAFVLISFLILAYHAKQSPRIRRYAIEKRGIWIDEKLIDYSRLKSFWIYRHPLLASELFLETGNPINPFIHIRLEGVNPDVIRQSIVRYLPEKEQKDAIPHQIARIIGF